MGQIVSPLVERPLRPATAGRLCPTLALARRRNRHQLLNKDGDAPAPMRDDAARGRSMRPGRVHTVCDHADVTSMVRPAILPADRWAIVARVRVRGRKRPASACRAPVAIV